MDSNSIFQAEVMRVNRTLQGQFQSLSLRKEVWQSVIRAIEKAVPEYDFVNEKVSLGHAQKTRDYVADRLELKSGMVILDAGISPGTMTQTIMSKTDGLIVVGLDASTNLLGVAKQRLGQSNDGSLHLVRGAFEALPFKDECFATIVSAYAFRDSRDQSIAIDEFHRVGTVNGIFAIVDLGKPENWLKRSLISIYLRYLMPSVARLSMSSSIDDNPWRMNFPTYQALRSNGELVESLGKSFSNVRITESALGGIIAIIARKG
jgi:demethylmenaquinone methyltransferase/2-methoxy-6-polyprenyl-1,4-benzoquinol methylase